MRFARFVLAVLNSPATWPLLTMWVVGGTTLSFRAAGYLSPLQVLIVMTTTVVVLVAASFWKELKKVHNLVNHISEEFINDDK